MSQLLKQKLMLVFISLTILVTFAGFLAANGSLAWFADNYEVSANGLSAKAQVSPNLVIVKSAEDFETGNLGFSVDMNGTANANMIAITRVERETPQGEKYYEYAYVGNPYAVNFETGNANDGDELELLAVPEESAEAYYVDYTVYIASTEKPLPVDSLRATIVIPETVDGLHNYFMAASVDFYLDSVGYDNYLGTATVAESQSNEDYEGVDVFPAVSGNVPYYKAEEDNYIKIVMRCYFDGALQGADGSAYINSYSVRTDGVVIGVQFTAKES